MSEACFHEPVENLLPHRGTMLLIDRIVEYADDAALAECRPKKTAWYADAAGQMPAWMGVELMAQTIAAHVAMKKKRAGLAAKPGALLGTRSYRSARPGFPPDMLLRITVRELFRDEGGLAAYDCVIAAAAVPLATATLKVYEPQDFATFVQGGQP